MKKILEQAKIKNQRALSEYDSKQLIKSAGVTITKEELATSKEEAMEIAEKIGFPVVLKGCSSTLSHKTESGVIHLKLENSEAVATAYDSITAKNLDLDGVLVQEMIFGDREFVIGLNRDPQFGPCVMFGLGGIYTEVFKDVSFRVAPLTHEDAEEMLEEIKSKEMLDEFRGSPAVDKELVIKALIGIGNLGNKHDEIEEIDINPIIISGTKAIAVDALVILKADN